MTLTLSIVIAAAVIVGAAVGVAVACWKTLTTTDPAEETWPP